MQNSNTESPAVFIMCYDAIKLVSMAYLVAIQNICCYLGIKVQNYQMTVKNITG